MPTADELPSLRNSHLNQSLSLNTVVDVNSPGASWRNDGERKLTVLVADDNASILEMASRLLATDFDVVAAVTRWAAGTARGAAAGP